MLRPVEVAAIPDPGNPILPDAPVRKLRLLAAEDNPINQRLIAHLLEKEGHSIKVVEDGAAAVIASRKDHYDAILVDIQMPNMDGYEATHNIRQYEHAAGEHVPIIAMTAHAMKGDREKCLAAGMDDYIAKPLHKQELLRVLYEHTQAMPHSAHVQSPVFSAIEIEEIDLPAALEEIGGDEQLFCELCQIFVKESQAMMDSLRDALQQEGNAEVYRSAHKLKGALSTLGARRAAEAALVVEELADSGEMEKLSGAVSILEENITRVRVAVSAVLDRARATGHLTSAVGPTATALTLPPLSRLDF